nr:MAG: hypothetical protein 3 [Leviviridae sp.]
MDFNPDTCNNLLQSCLARVYTRPLTMERLFAARVLRTSLFKKWKPSNSGPLEARAINTFLRCNAACGTLILDDSASTDLGSALRSFKAEMHKTFHSGPLQSNVLTLQACLDKGRCGPGSSVGTKKTDFFGKMCESTLTYTDEGLYHLYKYCTNETWRKMELIRHKRHGRKRVKGSNLTTVLKNSQTNRTICTEPSLNMFFQLGAGEVIEKLLLRDHNIDLATQQVINRAMAKCGSIMGINATVDLKSASDTIARLLVKYGLPPETFRVLDFIRSPYTKIDGKYYKLEMFSSMGNGFTFPLQTLIFATLVRIVYGLVGIIPKAFGPDRNYGVFGDDIICDVRAYEKLSEILHGCGFTVNLDKSFAKGAFRESCGGDYFRGADVRGVYLQEIKTDEDIYCAFNRLTRWSIKHRVDLSELLEYLLRLVKFRPVPFDVGDTAGFKYPSSYLTNKRYSKDGGLKYRASQSVDIDRKIGGDVSEENAAGLLIAHLGGYVKSSFAARHTTPTKRRSPVSNRVKYEFHTEEHHVTVRSADEQVAWKIVKKSTHSWDWIPHVGLTIQDYERVWMTLSLNN